MSTTVIRRLAAFPLRLALHVAGRAYVPGRELADALAIARRLAGDGIACTLGYFHDGTETADQLAALSRATVDAVAGLEPRGYLSIKAPAFHYRPAVVGAIVAAAREKGVLAHFDSHEPATAEPTFLCIQQAVAQGATVGVTTPGRWPRSPDDAAAAAALGVRVRVVKGEWPDPEAPALDLRQGFLAVIDRLAGQSVEVAVATHDPWLARESITRLQAAGTPCEIELLYGLPRRRLLALARELSVPVRLYLPFGASWRPYALGKVRDNPRMLWWVARDGLIGLFRLWRRP